jgi:hypothetical protein
VVPEYATVDAGTNDDTYVRRWERRYGTGCEARELARGGEGCVHAVSGVVVVRVLYVAVV